MRRDDILRALARFRDLKQDEFDIVRIGVFGSVAREGNTAEVMYSVCENHIEVLTQTVQVMLADLEKR